MHVQSFDSWEEAQAAMRKAEEAANASLVEEQRRITWGDYWCRPVPDLGIFVFGQVMPLELVMQEEMAAGSDPEELAYTEASLREKHERGYMFGNAYSVMEPRGELGDTHRANMWPITEEEFEEVKQHGWQPTRDFIRKVLSEGRAAQQREHPNSLNDDPDFQKVDPNA